MDLIIVQNNSGIESGVISLDMIPTTNVGSSAKYQQYRKSPPSWHIWIPLCLPYLTFNEMILAETVSRQWRHISRSSSSIVEVGGVKFSKILKTLGNDLFGTQQKQLESIASSIKSLLEPFDKRKLVGMDATINID
jgi:hypothetical protein